MTTYYAIPGKDGAFADLPEWEIIDHIVMNGPPPTFDAIAQPDGTWAEPVIDPQERLDEITASIAELEAEAAQLRAML
jgi:hypothetical protein